MAPQNYIGTAKDKITVSWSSDCSLSWDSARELLVKIENGVAGSWKRRHDKFLSISELLKDSTAVSGKKLAFYIPGRLQSEKDVFNVITQLVIHLPLTLLNRPGSRYIVNMCQIGFDCEELDSLFKTVLTTKLSLKRSNQQTRIKVAKLAENAS